MALTPEQVAATLAAMEKHGDNKAAIARELGLGRSAVQNRLERLSQTAPIAANTNQKPRIRVPYLRVVEPQPEPKEEAVRVCVIGDLHVAPGQDLSRLRWIARHIGETQPDYIVQIGDWSSFDSVSTHDPIGSIKANNRPSLRQDMEALEESLELFDRELGPSVIPRTVTLGNHEDRVRRYEQLRSELDESLWLKVLEQFARYRWRTFDFGKVVFLGGGAHGPGVGFTHCPINRMGKTHGSPNIMLNNLTHDLVKGHSHVATYLSLPKIGEGQGVTLIDVGTSLPHGHIEPYAKLSQTGWWYGVHDVTIRNGRIDDFARVSIKTLEAKYG